MPNWLRRGTRSESEPASRANVVVKRGRVLALASVLTVTPMVTGVPQISSPDQAHPVQTQVRHVAFATSSVASMRAAMGRTASALGAPGAPDPVTSARAGALAPVQDVTSSVTVVGVTWPKGAVSVGDQFQIRTLMGSTWSQWQSLDVDEADGPDPAEAAGATQGTSPYIVTGASQYQVRSLSTDPTPPTTAVVQVVDPGTSGADSNPVARSAAPGAAAAATIKPVVFPRASWGANESLRKDAPAYGRVEMGFVHHTDSSNTYASSQVPAMIRGIYAYHVQAQGWNDIGYNFLIDRFGRTWEGRFGGMEKAVVGAQTANYNSVSTGVSAIGNFDVAGVPQAMTNAFKRILAWKLALSSHPATGSVPSPVPPTWSAAKYFQRISGHRDGFQTACPGRYLFAKLPEIRAGAAAIIAIPGPPVVRPPVVKPPVVRPPVVRPPVVIRSVLNRDVDRNGGADALSYQPGVAGGSIRGSVSVLASSSRNPVSRGVAIGTGWNGLRNASLSRDLTGDGKADIVAQDRAGNRLRIYLGNGRGGFASVRHLGKGWNVMNRVLAAGDRNRDGRNDILATRATGELVYYPGTGTGSVAAGRVIARGWGIFRIITAAGDLNGDRLPDLLATRAADGVQVMYAGAAGGSLRPGVVWGRGWTPISAVAGGSDLDGDRFADVYSRLGDGMRTQSTNATGRFFRSLSWGAGWRSLTQLTTGADWNGDGVVDLLAVNPAANAGTLNLYAGQGPRAMVTRTRAFPSVPGADLVRLVGDVDRDGYTDAVARVRTNNTLVLLRGQPGSGFAAPRSIGRGWNAFNRLEAAGDYDGDGVPDLLARDAGGNLFVYPMMRNLTFKARTSIGVGFQGIQSVVGTGAFDRDAYGDVITLRAGDRALILYPGGGGRVLRAGILLARAQNDLTQILGAGDYNGDTLADVIARSGDGRLWLYPGNGLGAVLSRQLIRGGQGAGHVLG